MVLIACMVITFICSGMCYTPRGLYTAQVCEELGITRSAYNLSYSVASIVGLFVISINFATIRNFLGGYKNFILFALTLYIIGSVSGWFSNSIVTVYISSICIYIGYMSCGSLTLSNILGNWFPDRFGSTMGLVLSGTTMGGAIFSRILSRWIGSVGWRISYRNQVIVIAVCFVFILFAMKESPDGGKNGGKDKKKSKPDRSVLKDKNFYLLGFAVLLTPFALQALPLNAPTIMQDAGNSVEQAGTITSVMLVVCSLGKIFSGWLNDHIGVVRMRNILLCSAIVGVLCLIFAQNRLILYAYSIFFGLGYSIAILFLPFHVRYAFPGKDPGEIQGMLTAFTMVGSFVANPTISFVYEKTGSYTPVLIFLACTLAIVMALANLVKPGKKPEAAAE